MASSKSGEVGLVEKRLLAILIIFTLLLTGIAGKAFYEQVFMGPTYAARSLEIRTRQFPTEEYIRGDILDRNGVSLTDSAYRPSIVFFPRLINNPENLIQKISTQLPELKINIQNIKPYYQNGKKYFPEPFFIKVDENIKYAQIVNSWNEPGVTVVPIKTRYGKNSLAVHIVGYTDYQQKGIKGIEARFDEKLRGSRPEQIITPITDARNNFLKGLGYRIIDLGKDAVRNDIILTIDSRIQNIVEQVMDKRQIIKGAVVILDVKTGTILAAASRPEFDQKNPDKTYGFNDNQLERVIGDDYKVYPGSIFKVITAAAALEEGIVTPETRFICTGSSEYVTCPREHGELTFTEAMQYSCNVTFVDVGLKLGRKKLEEYMLNKFGFGLEENKRLDSARARANGIIGQELFRVSPLEIANMMATIARDGYHQKIVDPWNNRLVKAIKKDAKVENFTQTPMFFKLYSKETAEKLKEMLIATNKWGSGKRAWIEGYGSAGKTGTPEIINKNGEKDYLAWYTGYAPIKKPQYAVVVLIEEIEGLSKAALQGGYHAGPVFKEILEQTLALDYGF